MTHFDLANKLWAALLKVNTWTLTGIAFCAACGAPMYSSSAVYRAKRYSYYGCVHSLRRDGECVARRVKADELEPRYPATCWPSSATSS